MKRFKIGFLAVVAIMAMSFTVASSSGIIKSKAFLTLQPGHCYTTLPTNSSSQTPSLETCINPNNFTNGGTEFSDPSGPYTQICTNETQTFCCYEAFTSNCSSGQLKIRQLTRFE